MKVQIDRHGVLTIEPENHSESYALKCWQEKNTRHAAPGDWLGKSYYIRNFQIEDVSPLSVSDVFSGWKKPNKLMGGIEQGSDLKGSAND